MFLGKCLRALALLRDDTDGVFLSNQNMTCNYYLYN